MPDVTRLVRFKRGGRREVVLDLEQGASPAPYWKVRDSFTPTPPARTAIAVASEERYGGSRAVGETHANGAVSARFSVGGTTTDAALANLGALLRAVDDPGPDVLFEWRLENATRSTFYERRGPGTWAPVDYSANQVRQTSRMVFECSWPVAPLALGPPMDIFDDFAENSLADYTADAGTGLLSITAGALAPTGDLTVERRLIHTERGYDYGDAQVLAKVTPGPTLTNFKAGVVLKRRAANTYAEVYVEDTGTISRLRVNLVDGGVLTDVFTAPFAARIVAGQPFWVQGRFEGDKLLAEYFTFSPLPYSTATTSLTYNLTAPQITSFGAAVRGRGGVVLTPRHADARIDDLAIEPWTYRLRELPARIDLAGDVPGDVSALCDLSYAQQAGEPAAAFMLVGWGARRGPNPPLGVFEAEAATNVGGWAISGGGVGARGSNLLFNADVTGAASYQASFAVSPADLATSDPFVLGEVEVEVWARVWLPSTLVYPRLVASVRADAGNLLVAERFTAEHQSLGVAVAVPTASTYRFVRLGTLSLAHDPQSPAAQLVWITAQISVGSTGSLGLDYVVLVPARSRALSPTGKPLDAAYPRFLPASTGESRRKVVRRDLSGLVSTPPGPSHRDHGLGGSLPRLPSGAASLVLKPSSLVPDDPTLSAAGEALMHRATVHASVQPRFLLTRN